MAIFVPKVIVEKIADSHGYRVIQLENTLEPTIGTILETSDVADMLDDGIAVVIKKAKTR